MEAEPALVKIAFMVAVAAFCGIASTRLRQPSVVGYIFAGVLLGPSVLGIVRDQATIRFAADLGVLLLLFLAGMRLDFAFFKGIYKQAFVATALQISVSVLLLVMMAPMLGWSLPVAVFFGFVVSFSSTAIGLRMLDSAGELHSDIGRVVVGVLIAQDIAIVPIVIAVNLLVGAETIDALLLLKLGFAAVLIVGLIWYLNRYPDAVLPLGRFVKHHPDLLAVSALMGCFAAAVISGLLGLSTALGAFLAGLYLGNTAEQKRLTGVTQPIEGVLVMIFFVSIGLLIDLHFLIENIVTVALLLVVVFVSCSFINFAVLRVVKVPWKDALVAGFALGQIGEFSFVLSEIAFRYGMIGEPDRNLVVALIGLGMVISPLWFHLARRGADLPVS